MKITAVMAELRRLADPAVVAGMARFGVPSDNALGVSAPKLRALARKIGQDQELSLELWQTGVLEARAIAALIGEPKKVTRRQMNRWASEFDSWSVCDACCCLLFVFTPFALEMAFKWATSKREFVKRAGFVLMAASAVHLKELTDREFLPMLDAVRLAATDDRNFVKKAVSWALRQIGKRNRKLNALAIKEAMRIRKTDSRTARWIAADALRELQSSGVERRFRKWERKS